MDLLSRFPRLLPRSIGGQCILGLVLGLLAFLLLGPRVAVLNPLGQIFLRASQIAVMPYLICELAGSLGSLLRASWCSCRLCCLLSPPLCFSARKCCSRRIRRIW